MFRHAGGPALRVLVTLWVTLGITVASVVDARAQSVSGTILGTVTDQSGAVISNAKVTVTNEGTGLTRTVITDRNGDYVVPSIPTGRYVVVAEVAGFKTLALSNIEVGVDQRARIDLKLEVGALTE